MVLGGAQYNEMWYKKPTLFENVSPGERVEPMAKEMRCGAAGGFCSEREPPFARTYAIRPSKGFPNHKTLTLVPRQPPGRATQYLAWREDIWPDPVCANLLMDVDDRQGNRKVWQCSFLVGHRHTTRPVWNTRRIAFQVPIITTSLHFFVHPRRRLFRQI